MIRIFTYEIQYVDEITHEVHEQCGITYGNSMSDAVKVLEEHYGGEYLFSINNFNELASDYPIVLPKVIVEAVMNEDYVTIDERKK